MQISATIIAAQQAAREARAALNIAPKPATSFLAELGGSAAAPAEPKQAAAPSQAAPQALMRPGSLLDIKI
jgi:hypothetical protein